MQEMHKQKMHYLHEFHRKEIHDRDRRLVRLQEERKRYAWLSSPSFPIFAVGWWFVRVVRFCELMGADGWIERQVGSTGR